MTRREMNRWVQLTLINAFILALNVVAVGAIAIMLTVGGAS
jgi:hypothetical protein